MSGNATVPVLIAGAGPTGLNVALSLVRRGVPCRIISAANGPGENSRAMVVQARTLEFYGQFGFVREVIDAGVPTGAVHIRTGGDDGASHELTTVSFSDLGGSISPFPFALAYPQDDHERFLIEKLEEAGCKVEWQARLASFTQDGDGVLARISRNGQAEEIRAQYLCGCDGAHSAVRETLNIGFPGGTYEQVFYVADGRISRGFDRDLYINVGEHVLTLMLPVRSSGVQRFIGLVPPELSEHKDLTFEDLRPHIEHHLDVTVVEVNWLSTYRVHHRVAERFRTGRAFLAGDAGHIHSPAGGQGMNTGIGDAINLGWKLAQVIQGRADPSLLETYEPERIGFARSLVSTTDWAFTHLVAADARGELVRRVIAPFLFPIAVRLPPTRHAIFRLVSQARIHYPDSPLSEGRAGHVYGGDRLPWTGPGEQDNFAPLRSLDWQLHVYGNITDELGRAARERNLAVQTFLWSEGMRQAGFSRGAAYLVRPDGYVSIALPEQSAADLKRFLDRFRMKFSAGA